ncbi:acetyl-CoA carboxylase biotin carboxylase subunit [Saccharothrix australiensis]|uniref:biotin carboxylase n=1 Tax=Saccharothrix australiensis TaxID=2072 RepID=A0A495VWA8_9PSEU|nr:biotin carboxylase N-terminal domain-containing protein [Saccharothrix australiensis]RKT53616.1 acetyl-CoA carboxylase biotin carboxylase subunit [Saccharothrix australiensis]
MIDTLLVGNRGEVAVRIVRACRLLGIRSVVAHSAADRDTLPVRLADDRVCLGPARAGHSYLSIPALLYACARVDADAVHPGYGFLAEDPDFAAACRDSGIAWVGPSPEHVALLGDKIATRDEMARAGLPVAPGSRTHVTDLADATRQARDIGYPIALKAASGGGGRGVLRVDGDDHLAECFGRAGASARALFQDGRLYVEKWVEHARHVEVQVLGDRHGNAISLGERDCSVQRRNRKLIEESPAPGLAVAVREALGDLAVRAARHLGLRNLATVEFLVDDRGEFFCTEINPRLQVEHPVTESVTGQDLVAWMIREAMGEPVPCSRDDVWSRGHAVEARITAEDPERDWAPGCGTVHDLVVPGGPGIRVDTWLTPGTAVSPHYDPLLAKVVSWGPDRDTARRRLVHALEEFTCVGVTHNAEALIAILRHDEFSGGEHRAGVVDRARPRRTASDEGAP